MHPIRTLQGLCAAALLATPAAALHIDFEGFAHGTVIDDQYQGVGVGIVTRNFNPDAGHPDLGVAFDTTSSGNSDDDLEQPWSLGNLVGTDLGNVLIIQENDLGCHTGICSTPDDEGRRPAGRFSIFFDERITEFGFDLVDVESVAAEDGKVKFYLDGQLQGEVAFSDFVDPGSGFYDPSVAYGDNSANRISPIAASAFGSDGFDEVRIKMGGSGGVDNLRSSSSPVPEPTGLALFALGLPLIAHARRRRS